MITPEIFENDTYKSIYFRNEDDVAIRHLVMDLQGNIIQDEISEYSKDGKHLTSVVFNADYSTILGYREYHYDSNGRKTGYSDYKRIHGELKLIAYTKSEWIEFGKKAICRTYDGKHNLLHYDIFEYDKNCGMLWSGKYDKEGKNATYFPTPLY